MCEGVTCPLPGTLSPPAAICSSEPRETSSSLLSSTASSSFLCLSVWCHQVLGNIIFACMWFETHDSTLLVAVLFCKAASYAREAGRLARLA